MTKIDALVLAGDVAAELERYGMVACGRREDGVARVDFWTHEGRGFKYPVSGEEELAVLVLQCLDIAGARPTSAAAHELS
jgi:hypothetical protein